MSLPRCYAPDAAAGVVDLPPEEAHHVARVLRLPVGAAVAVFDGRGHEWVGRIASLDRRHVSVALVGVHPPVAEPPVAVTLAIGLLKGDQMNAVVRDATALGAAALQPFVSAHVAVPERAWRDRSLERWRRVAVASAKQCGRASLLEILDIVSFPQVLENAAPDGAILCVEPVFAVAPADGVARTVPADRITVCIGPEGGWAPAELELARAQRARLLGLGPRTLRAELAPTVALAVLWAAWGWTK